MSKQMRKKTVFPKPVEYSKIRQQSEIYAVNAYIKKKS